MIMKNFNSYINEKLIISTDTIKRPKREYTCAPKTKEELLEVIRERIRPSKSNGQEIVNLNDIDVWAITDMSELFSSWYTYAFDVSLWEVDNVTNMESMFYNCYYFNSNLSNWHVGNVKNMKRMFFNCSNFTGEGLDKWDVHSVEYMTSMFNQCEKLNLDVSKWKTINLKDTKFMFKGCKGTNIFGFDKWDVSNVQSFRYMFYQYNNLKDDLSEWKFDNAKDITSAFALTTLDCDISKWNLSNVEYFNSAFYNCHKLKADISGWKFKKAKDVSKMFYGCDNLDCDFSNWKFPEKTITYEIFKGTKSEEEGKLPEWYKD